MRLAQAQEENSALHETIYGELTRMQVMREANRCLYCYDAPCVKACPTHIDIPSFIRKIATDNVLGSARVILQENPVGASCARVCPTEDLCEGACVLGEQDEPIHIGDLQRYATDFVRARDVELFVPGALTGMKVAVVGGGPAGLSAARELAVMGHDVTIYEAKAKLGGLCTYGIVPFRLPMDVALWEAEQVVRLGVHVRRNTVVGKDVSVDELLHSYHAILLAYGLGKVPRLGLEGEDLAGVLDAIEFIEKVKTGEDAGQIGDKVAIIGAGNTAIDAATSAKRLGAKEVTLFYRKTAREMTAYPFEVEFAKQEGVQFRFQCTPLRFVGDGQRVQRMELVETELKEVEGRLLAVPKPDSMFSVEVDTVIRAIGQTKLSELADLFGVSEHEGAIRVDNGCRTSHPKIFAAGDVTFDKGVAGEAMVVEAAEQGKIAAKSVDRFLATYWETQEQIF
ncbi:NAD(P)-dependent oxidoreductase [Sulfoacidibacillus thermotolerans]|uniref:Dihydropyrimidine dehydrogenase n=1 Tax=Sulfoacidibacillus thermotolerans TaxID=1765684 RepID=A0A2U3D980_SULT2|nr:NAD(P)-dependent oxidoreductase [Sulfoacidibacillus thermotolerans]PWI57837.1 dihydropyrimidine dehydrogenase [Sulfoacidibacillus thermotolerans]